MLWYFICLNLPRPLGVLQTTHAAQYKQLPSFCLWGGGCLNYNDCIFTWTWRGETKRKQVRLQSRQPWGEVMETQQRGKEMRWGVAKDMGGWLQVRQPSTCLHICGCLGYEVGEGVGHCLGQKGVEPRCVSESLGGRLIFTCTLLGLCKHVCKWRSESNSMSASSQKNNRIHLL